mgnify:CR=1 FL=1
MKLILVKENGERIHFKNRAKGVRDFIIHLDLLFKDLGINIRILFDE